MASMKDAYIAGPDHTAVLPVDGKRLIYGYPNGSLFFVNRDTGIIMRKLSKEEADRYGKRHDWKPL